MLCAGRTLRRKGPFRGPFLFRRGGDFAPEGLQAGLVPFVDLLDFRISPGILCALRGLDCGVDRVFEKRGFLFRDFQFHVCGSGLCEWFARLLEHIWQGVSNEVGYEASVFAGAACGYSAL